jgi:hypothetical protein
VNEQPTWWRCGGPSRLALDRCAARTKAGHCCGRPAQVIVVTTPDGVEQIPARWCRVHMEQYQREAAAQGGAEIRRFP